MNSLVVLLAVQTLVSIFIIVWVRLKVMRSLDDGDSIARVRREIGALIVELDGSADRNITVIEDRLRELKDCIAEADKRIIMLSNEKARAWDSPPVPLLRASQDQWQESQDHLQESQDHLQESQDHLQESQDQLHASRLPAPAFQAPVLEAPQPIETSPLRLQSPRQQVRTQESAKTPSYGKEGLASQDTGPSGNLRAASVPFIRFSDKPLVFEEPFAERVARLHKRGFSSDIIAAKLKATIAEVDLAIAAGWNPPEGRGEG